MAMGTPISQTTHPLCLVRHVGVMSSQHEVAPYWSVASVSSSPPPTCPSHETGY